MLLGDYQVSLVSSQQCLTVIYPLSNEQHAAHTLSLSPDLEPGLHCPELPEGLISMEKGDKL